MMADRIGQQLGNYRLIRLLGQGGFADVYLGEHVYLKIQAAIKVLQMRLANDDMEDFLNEARTIASLKHSHIVRVLDFGIDSNTPFLVMDYAPMGTLRQRYPKGTRLSPATIVPYVKQVATALQYAHDKKLIHRDIKPENMLLESDNDIMLSDFGIATIAQSSRYQNTQEAVGTLAYMAPEQLQGKPRIASDQYSLGIVVYEWLTGDRPFHGSFVEMASQHMLVPPPPIREKISGILPPIEEVVMVALAKDPQQRFMSVQAFANALEQACQPNQSYPIVPKSQSLQPKVAVNPLSELLEPTILTPPHPPLPPTVKVLSDVKISQSLGTTLYTYRGHSDSAYALAWSNDSQYIASASNEVKVWDAATGYDVIIYSNHFDEVNALAWSPDGKCIASASNNSVHVWNANTGGSIFVYTNHFDGVNAVAWSPNGKLIASSSNSGTVHVWDASTGANVFTYRGHTGAVYTVAWSPDGMRIASGGENMIVQVWDIYKKFETLVYRGHSKGVTEIAWSPDGTRIASGSDDKTVHIWDAATGRTILSYRNHSNLVNAIVWSPNGKYIASASADETVQIWQASTGGNVFTYHNHSDIVWSVAWSPDGTRIASSGDDKTVQVWQAP